MTNTHTYKGIAWIDLESPEENEITSLINRYGLHPLVGEELHNPESPSRVNSYNDYTLISLSFPVRTKIDGTHIVNDHSVTFVIGKNFLITSRTGAVEQLEYFAKIFEANEILGNDEKIEHAGHIFYYMIKRLYSGMREDLENIRDAVTLAEEKIFKGHEKNMVEHLSKLNRELIDFKQTIRIHRDIWLNLTADLERSVFGKEFSVYIEDLNNDFSQIHEITINIKELLSDLRETNDSLLNTKQNEIIKDLTLIAFIFYPLTFIASIFTIPASDVPIIDRPYGWSLIMIAMVIMSIGIWYYFKRKNWV